LTFIAPLGAKHSEIHIWRGDLSGSSPTILPESVANARVAARQREITDVWTRRATIVSRRASGSIAEPFSSMRFSIRETRRRASRAIENMDGATVKKKKVSLFD